MEKSDKIKVGALAGVILIGVILIALSLIPSKPAISEQGAPKASAGGPLRGANPNAAPTQDSPPQ